MNPIMFDFGLVSIRWYSFFILISFVIGGYLAIKEAKKWNISEDFMINLAFYLIPISILGARLYYVAFNWDYYKENLIEIIKIWNGGLAIHGGIIAGFLFLVLYCHKYKIRVLRMMDILVVSLILGQAIGRWGNFMNGEAYGPATTLAFLQSLHLPKFIIDGMYINGTYYQPTFLYESLWNLVGFILLLQIRKRRYNKIGQVTGFYFIWYGIGRFLIEFLRQDALMFHGFRVAQIASVIMVIVGLLLFILRARGSKFDNLYNDRDNKEQGTF